MYILTDPVMKIVRREFPFASIIGVESESELESSLVNAGIEAPFTLSTTASGAFDAGCLRGGAGVGLPFIHYQLHILQSIFHTSSKVLCLMTCKVILLSTL